MKSTIIALASGGHLVVQPDRESVVSLAFEMWLTSTARISVIGPNGEYQYVGDQLPIVEYVKAAKGIA